MHTLLFTFMFNMVGFNFYFDTNPNSDDTPHFDYSSAEMRRDCLVDSMTVLATTCIGVKYQYGGSSKSGFDCSGFVNYVFSSFGISLPRSSYEIANLGSPVAFDELQPGDLVFFKGRSTKSTRVGHVGMVVEKTNEGFKMIHASVSRGVRIDSYSTPYYKARFLFGKRLDLVS